MLIKVVTSAIPTYIMACFRIPKKIYKEMNLTLANFWWGQKAKEWKIHWKSWIRLTMAKSLEEWVLKT